jgi:hypothetical protein
VISAPTFVHEVWSMGLRGSPERVVPSLAVREWRRILVFGDRLSVKLLSALTWRGPRESGRCSSAEMPATTHGPFLLLRRTSMNRWLLALMVSSPLANNETNGTFASGLAPDASARPRLVIAPASAHP